MIELKVPGTIGSTGRRLALAAVALAALGAGCASVPAPTTELALSAAAISHAAGAGAALLAPQQLQLARDKQARAQVAMADERFVDARRLATQAAVDAQLAEARTETARSANAAAELNKAGRVLEEEMARRPPATPKTGATP